MAGSAVVSRLGTGVADIANSAEKR
jgi:hypothetical protein